MCLFLCQDPTVLIAVTFFNQSTNESLIIEAARYSRKINEGEARKAGFSPSLVPIGETSWILGSEMSLELQGADIVSYLLCDLGQGYEMHWALVSYQENGK